MLAERRRASVVAAVALIALAVLPGPGELGAAEQVTAERIGGVDRYETAALMARATFPFGPNRAYDVWVARGDLFPDALAASYPAGQYNGGGPLVLTPTDRLHPAARGVIEELAWRVWIMGDSTAVSAEVEAEIAAMPNVEDVIRVSGVDRYYTASAAVSVYPDGHFEVGLLATGTNFADALAAGPLAYSQVMPLLLTTPDSLHPAARQWIEQALDEVIIVGGTAAVSDTVRQEIEQICRDGDGCVRTRRIGGSSRTETAALLADELVQRMQRNDPDWVPTHVNLARGDAFPDAAAGGSHGGEELAPLLLTTDPTNLGDPTRQWLETHNATIESIHVFGTRDAVSGSVVAEARAAATS